MTVTVTVTMTMTMTMKKNYAFRAQVNGLRQGALLPVIVDDDDDDDDDTRGHLKQHTRRL